MKRRKSRFTMVEMIIVVMIIAVLVAVGTPMYLNYLKDARVTAAKRQIALFEQAILDYSMRMGKLPPQDPGLEALIRNPGNDSRWRPFLSGDSVPLDPWSNKYVYRNLGNGEYEILSYGADGVEGGEGDNADITNRTAPGAK